MLTHMRTKHKDNVRVQSPLGNFPSSNLARILFDDDDNLSTQGNSKGQVNSPKVRSVMSFQCGACNKIFDKNEEAILHMKEIHPKEAAVIPSPAPSPVPSPTNRLFSREVEMELSNEEEVLVAAAEEEDKLYEELLLLTQSIKEPESDNLNEKLVRLKHVMLKKTALQKETTDKVKSLMNELDVVNHNCTLMKEIIERQTDELEVARKEAEKNNKDIRTQRDKHKKEQETLEKELTSLRENNGELYKENSDLKTKLITKESIIEVLKETSANNNEVEVIEQNVCLSKDSEFHQCNACDRIFKESNDLENHIAAKHEEKQCTYCEKICSNEQDLVKHHNECIDIGVANAMCTKCKETFTNQGLKRHSPNCHGGKKYFECTECDEIYGSKNAVKKHKDKEHPLELERSKEVCYHWRRGHCEKGNRCPYSHVGRQENQGTTTNKVPACSNGPHCEWLFSP